VRDLPVRDLNDKSVLITGAGRGIGKRLALGFAQAGARVGLLARTKAELDLAQLEIEHSGGIALSLRADVRDYEQVIAAVQRMTVRFGPPQVLVCAAGVLGPIGGLAGSNPSAWREVVDTNLVGTFHACRAVLPVMRELRCGKLLLLADTGAEIGRPYFSAYAASKAALVRLAESLAEEVREDNIQVNCLNPGAAYTSMTDEILRAPGISDRDRADALQVRTTGGTAPDRQIQLALFLASDRSNHISGKLIHITDDWRRLESATLSHEIFSLRRLTRS
jgi:NAD(P)-dependent dehydrogenase (short-subunit alcohol dehydrogenase family)